MIYLLALIGDKEYGTILSAPSSFLIRQEYWKINLKIIKQIKWSIRLNKTGVDAKKLYSLLKHYFFLLGCLVSVDLVKNYLLFYRFRFQVIHFSANTCTLGFLETIRLIKNSCFVNISLKKKMRLQITVYETIYTACM